MPCSRIVNLEHISIMCLIPTPGTIMCSVPSMPIIFSFSVVASPGPWYPAFDVAFHNFSVESETAQAFFGLIGTTPVVASFK